MKSLVRSLPALLALAACQPAPANQAAAPAAAPKPAAAPAPPAPDTLAPPYLGYHRYRGTVGGRPVTVELTIGAADTYPHKNLACTGSYYYGQGRAGQLRLSAAGTYQPRQPLQLRETDGDRATGTWQATQPAGPVLAGTWRGTGGRELPFMLREDYTDGQGHLAAVRYEVVNEESVGWPCESLLKNIYPRATLFRQYLHLLGPDTLHPALRVLQCPLPRRRRAARQAFARSGGACQETTEGISVALNDYGLLSLLTSSRVLNYEAGHFDHNLDGRLYDLRTGRELPLLALLRPGADTLLQQLIGRHLMKESDAVAGSYKPGHWPLLPPGLWLGFDGLLSDDGTNGGSTTIPYAELLPLLRPNSPVARMLRERGLWRGK